jgi:3-deoxy-D-manno-octulosonic-acid transferase
MHVASLGEFEQGLPVIEKFSREEWEIIVTFFSPSGYEYRKKHPAADAVFYLPADSETNAQQFLNLVQPDLVLFVKYDFWYYYLTETKKRNIPLYLISALFRESQPFFKNSALHREMLMCFNHIFTQDNNSVKLLAQHGYNHASQAGDTRCDRVIMNAQNVKSFPLIEKFKQDKKILVAGSSWPEEETLLAAIYGNFEKELKLIIAPHNISDGHVAEIEKRFTLPTIRYSKLTEEDAGQYSVVIIDNIGMLSSLYRYADIAVIGGAFRKGLHNILEAAVFTIPVLYGPPISKYPEGKRLADAGGGFIIKDEAELKAILQTFLSDESKRLVAGKNAHQFIRDNAGAAERIYTAISSAITGL